MKIIKDNNNKRDNSLSLSSSYSSTTPVVIITFLSILFVTIFSLFMTSDNNNYFSSFSNYLSYDMIDNRNSGWLSALALTQIAIAQEEDEEQVTEDQQQEEEETEEQEQQQEQEEEESAPPVSVDDECSSDEYFNTNYNMCLPEEEKDCQDGIDDDGDGYVDTNDSDCGIQETIDDDYDKLDKTPDEDGRVQEDQNQLPTDDNNGIISEEICPPYCSSPPPPILEQQQQQQEQQPTIPEGSTAIDALSDSIGSSSEEAKDSAPAIIDDDDNTKEVQNNKDLTESLSSSGIGSQTTTSTDTFTTTIFDMQSNGASTPSSDIQDRNGSDTTTEDSSTTPNNLTATSTTNNLTTITANNSLIRGAEQETTTTPETKINSAIDADNKVISPGDLTTSNFIEFDIQGSVKEEKESGLGNLGEMICSLDNEPYSLCLQGATSAYDRVGKAYSDLTNGTHTFKAAFSITASNGTYFEDPTPATFTWKINSTNITTTNTNTTSPIKSNNNTMSNEQVVDITSDSSEKAKLIVITKVVGMSTDPLLKPSSDFTIEVYGNNSNPFESKGSESGTPITLGFGEYSVNVINPPPVYLQEYSSGCSGIIKNSNEIITCTITNTKSYNVEFISTIEVEKNVLPPLYAADVFAIEVRGIPAIPSKFYITAANSGTATIKVSGTKEYEIVEKLTPSYPGYTTTYSEGCKGYISPQQTKKCIITNTAIPPSNFASLVVFTKVINDNNDIFVGQQQQQQGKQMSGFNVDVSGNSPVPSSFKGSERGIAITISPGEYKVSQTPVNGYSTIYSEGCSGIINADESKTCTITNDDLFPGGLQKGTLKVITKVSNDGHTRGGFDFPGIGGKSASDFSMTVTGNNNPLPRSFSGTTLPKFSIVTMDPGVYSVSSNQNPKGNLITFSDGQTYIYKLEGDCQNIEIKAHEIKQCIVSYDDENPAPTPGAIPVPVDGKCPPGYDYYPLGFGFLQGCIPASNPSEIPVQDGPKPTAETKPVPQSGFPNSCKPRTGYTEYGCYCGAGNSCKQGDYSCAPVNKLDAACRKHDMEYKGCSFQDRYNDKNPFCFAYTHGADMNLCKAVENIRFGSSLSETNRFIIQMKMIFC